MNKKIPSLALLPLALSAALILGCGPKTAQPSLIDQPQQQQLVDLNERANQLFEQIFNERVQRSPILQTSLGIKDDYDKWQDLSDQAFKAELAMTHQHLALLEAIDSKALDAQTQLSYQLMHKQLSETLEDARWRLYSYPVNQMFGVHSQVASVLINQHRISDVNDAKAYIARLNAVPLLFRQLQQQLTARAEIGVIVPQFVFPHLRSASENIIQGAPFDEQADSTLLADFKGKVAQLGLSDVEQKLLIDEATVALLTSVGPAYRQFLGYLEQLEQQADTVDGVWRFQDGDAFYQHRLTRMTTTDMTASQIHQLGLDEVARIHTEMQAIMQQVSFEGTLQEFFVFMRETPQFYYPDTAEGRAEYLTAATAIIDHMRTRLDELFLVKPKADMIVQAVEPFREQSAGKAFYQRPSMDGSRPGVYYANLYRMSDMPKYQMEALAYHEGIPGHHMQLAIAQELEGIPKFRRFGGATAYIEGWGLYSELLPKEIGLYEDPYSNFGRLAMELWRAARLVVDSGLHAKKWSREQAIQYLLDNTPNPAGDASKAIERYIVMPGQATAYTVGMIKILELRQRAKTALGDNFDIREFHQVVLQNGAVPLDILEQLVTAYINERQPQDAS
ncbi:hypothetical protein GCM10010919_09970 [Alishewanella longhuensis]|uniref:DUF885 domain-containing protein n=1 Tax=Alishewanella longhuensis TaxID=1091037 RepID=A0ABQ3KVD6_9ALTE|nr:DUF885 domain-containing protein [Alishewanella longhuensis]GHG63873.1 hypothetical protein GCM10010919_09970 [Alishewanella longhuensis]